MAHLIKLDLKPQKWLLNDLHKRIKYNIIIDEFRQKNIDKTINNFAKERKLVRDQIKQYCVSKYDNKIRALKRGIDRYKSRLVVETILLFTSWQNNINEESHAIEVLAQKIAINIINAQEMPFQPSAFDEVIKQRLRQFISWHLVVPEALFSKVKERHSHLMERLNLPLIKSDKDLKTHLSLTILNSSFSLDFCDEDIDKILATVHNQLLPLVVDSNFETSS